MNTMLSALRFKTSGGVLFNRESGGVVLGVLVCLVRDFADTMYPHIFPISPFSHLNILSVYMCVFCECVFQRLNLFYVK